MRHEFLVAGLVALTALAFYPLAIEPGQVGRWAVLSAGLPLVALLAGPVRITAPMVLFAGWLGYVWLSLLWTPSTLDGLDAAWRWTLFATAVLVGAAGSVRIPLVAFAAAMAAMGAVAAAQAWGGLDWFPQRAEPGALFVNRNYLAEALAMAAVASVGLRLWWAVPGIVLGLVLTGSGGAFLALGAVLAAWLLLHERWGLSGLLAPAGISLLVFAEADAVSLAQRLHMWSDALGGLSLFGHGVGSFPSIYPLIGTPGGNHLFAFDVGPAHPHNDLLAMASDTGLFALLPVAALASAFMEWRREPVAAGVLLACLGAGLVGFPLANPLPLLVAGLCAGRLAAVRQPVRRRVPDGARPDLSRLARALPARDDGGPGAGGPMVPPGPAHPGGECARACDAFVPTGRGEVADARSA